MSARFVSVCQFQASADFIVPPFSQPVLADEVQTFKALITIHKVLQEGHPIVVREAQQHVNWVDSLMRGVGGDGIRGAYKFLSGGRWNMADVELE